jgi:hypothetical protein
MRTRAILSLAVAALAACASPEADLAKQAPQTLVGMPKGDLLACAGVPQRSTVGPDGTEYLSYGRQQTNIHRDYDAPSLGGYGLGLGGGTGPFSIFGGVDTWTTEYSCVATFTVRQGRVVDLRYNENRDIQLCYQTIGGCLPPVRR